MKRRSVWNRIGILFLVGILPAATAWADGELEQNMARGLARTFRAVAADAVPRTVCLRMRVGPKTGYGSAALISADGLALTCAHVVEVSDRIDAVTSSGKVCSVTVLGRNSVNDYALVRIAGGPFPFFPLGDSGRLSVGQWVMALGHPGGPYSDGKPAFAMGRITGLHKRLPVQMQKKFYDDAIKTNVPIFAGNSGGPLVDMEGRLVGINGAILLLNENAYAVPVNEIKADLPALGAGRNVAGRQAGGYREMFRDLQSEINPGDLKKLFGKTSLGKMFGKLMERFGDSDTTQKKAPPHVTRNDFLVRYFRPLNRKVRDAVVEIMSKGTRVGYGVVVDPAGLVLTNYRIAGEGPVQVRIARRGTFAARVLGRHGPLDVTLLRLNGDGPWAATSLGSTEGLRPGDWVITASPGDAPGAVGVVSALGRRIGTRRKVPTMGLFGMFGTPNESPLRPYDCVLHHDSRLTRGSFGSPLFDAEGRLVGLNAANFYPGSSFAVRAQDIARIYEDLKTGIHVPAPPTYGPEIETSPFGGGADLFKGFFEKFKKMFSGGDFDFKKFFGGDMDLDKLLEKFMGRESEKKTEKPKKKKKKKKKQISPSPFLGVSPDPAETDSAVVDSVVKGSAAEKAGLLSGDIIVRLAGRKVSDFASLRDAVARVKVGRKVSIEVLRDGKKISLVLVMGSRSE
jgi:S1-C subfamily serine protease